MRKQIKEEVFRNLKNTKIGIYLTNYQYFEGFLLDFKQDHLVIEVDENIHYFACEHIQAISKNTKDNYVSSREFAYLNRENLNEVLGAMQSTWVSINGSGNQVYYGVVSRVIEDYILLINNEELFYISKPLISKVSQLEKESGESSSVEINIETNLHDADTNEIVEVLSADSDITLELSTTLESMDSIDSHEDEAFNLQLDVNEDKAKVDSVSRLTHELEEPRQSSKDEEITEVFIEEDTEEVLEISSTEAKVELPAKLPAKLELMKILYFSIDDRKGHPQSKYNDKDSFEKYDTHIEQESEQHSNLTADDESERVLPEASNFLKDMEEVPPEVRLEKLVEEDIPNQDERKYPTTIDFNENFDLALQDDNIMSTSMLDKETLIEEFQLAYESAEVLDKKISEEFNMDEEINDHQLIEIKEDLNLLQLNIDHLLGKTEESSSVIVVKNDKEFERDFEAGPISEIEVNRNKTIDDGHNPIKIDQHAMTRSEKSIKVVDLEIYDEKSFEIEELNSGESTDTRISERQLCPKEEKEMLQEQYISLMKHAADYLLKLENHVGDDELSNEALLESFDADTFQLPFKIETMVERQSALEGQYISLMNHAAKMYWQLRG